MDLHTEHDQQQVKPINLKTEQSQEHYSQNGESDNSEIITFDEVLTKIGQGKYQLVIYIVMALIGMTEGAQITIFTLTIPILKHQWDVEDYLNSLQASLVFVGFLIGAMISGQVADRLGRQVPFLASSCMTFVVTYLTALSTNIYQMIILRFLMGMLVGFFGPLGMTLLAETTPQQQRGRYMSLVTISVSIGQLVALVSGYFILDNLQEGNWRMLIAVTVIPGTISWFIIIFWLDESARFLLCSGEYEKSFKILDRMNQVNGKVNFQELDHRMKQGLTNWSKKFNEKFDDNDKASISGLFKGDLKIITPIIWLYMFCLSFVYFGILILLPSLLDKINNIQYDTSKSSSDAFGESEDMAKLILTTTIEMISGVLASIMIEIKGFGRKNSMINFFLIQAITLFMVYYDDLSRFIFWTTLTKFYQMMNYAFSYQYITEVYSTKVRTTGIGMANSVGRIGGILMPWICAKLQEYDILLPFLLFSVLSLSMSALLTLLPYDTLGRDIDSIEEDDGPKKTNQVQKEKTEKLANSFISVVSQKSNSPKTKSTIKFQSIVQRIQHQAHPQQQEPKTSEEQQQLLQ
ncbi:hypothetical protein ABPG72_006954 [Tetrahymena utriculariae]